jgi:hypothetical protein
MKNHYTEYQRKIDRQREEVKKALLGVSSSKLPVQSELIKILTPYKTIVNYEQTCNLSDVWNSEFLKQLHKRFTFLSGWAFLSRNGMYIGENASLERICLLSNCMLVADQSICEKEIDLQLP